MMQRINLLLLGFTGLVGSIVFAQEASRDPLWPYSDRPETSDPTSLKIINLHLMARGGAEALEGITSIRRKGVLLDGKDDYSFTALFMTPDKARFEKSRTFIGRDYQTVRGTDGSNVWHQEVLPRKVVPNQLTGSEEQYVDFEARLPFLFLDDFNSRQVFAYRGESKYARRPVYIVHGWLASGMEVDIHFDAKNFHILNYRIPYRIGTTEVLVDRSPSGMRKIGDTWWESGYHLHIRGKKFRKVTYEESETRIETSENAFTEPVPKEFWLRH